MSVPGKMAVDCVSAFGQFIKTQTEPIINVCMINWYPQLVAY